MTTPQGVNFYIRARLIHCLADIIGQSWVDGDVSVL